MPLKAKRARAYNYFAVIVLSSAPKIKQGFKIRKLKAIELTAERNRAKNKENKFRGLCEMPRNQ